MPSRRTVLQSVSALAILSAHVPSLALAEEPLRVVATFSILGDMVANIGGDHIVLTTLVGPDGDAHVYQPTPQAARSVADADVLVMNGLDFEGWLERLAEAADFDGAMIVATTGIQPLEYEDHDDQDPHAGDVDHEHDEDHAEDEDHHDHDDHDADHAESKDHDDHGHGEEHAEMDDHQEHAEHDHGAFDPHAWLNASLAVTYVDNIAAGLAQADPVNAGIYYANRAAYLAELEALSRDIEALTAVIPDNKRTIVTSHDAFGYYADAYGFRFEAPQGLSTESEPSAADVARLITQIRNEDISAVYVETITDNRLLEQIANETNASIGGTLYSDALSGPDGPAATYIDMMRHNTTTLAEALGS